MTRNGGTECLDDDACCLLCLGELTAGHNDEVTRLYAESGNNSILDRGDELRDTTDDLAVLIHSEPAGLVAGLNFDIGDVLIDEFSGLLEVGDNDGLDTNVGVRTIFGLTGKRREAAVLENVGSILDGQVDTEVRLICAVLLHRLEVRDTGERCAGCTVICAVLGKDRRKYIFDDREDIFLSCKSHLHIELVELSRRSVASGILITEARSDLEISVEAGGHQELLELLRSLRKCVELTRVLSGRNEIVTSAFRRRSGEDRCGDLHEVMLHHSLTECSNDVAAKNDVLLNFRITKVEITVLQTCILICLAGVVDLERKFVIAAAAEYFYLGRNDLDVAGCLIRVLRRTLTDYTGHLDRGLLIDRFEFFYLIFGLQNDLCRSVEVAEDNEAEIASDLTHIFHPAGKRYCLSRVGKTELAAVMCP